MKILFVCEGNVMRSPMAAAFYNDMTGTSDAFSAGAAPFPISGPAMPEVVAAMEENGVDLNEHTSQAVTVEMVHDADVIVAFPTPRMPAYVLNSPKTIRWEVDDPYYQPNDGTDYVRKARDEIYAQITAFITENQEAASSNSEKRNTVSSSKRES